MSEGPAALINTRELNVILLALGPLGCCDFTFSNFKAESTSKVRDWQLELGHQLLNYNLDALMDHQSTIIVPDSCLQVAHDDFAAVLEGLKGHEAGRRHPHA